MDPINIILLISLGVCILNSVIASKKGFDPLIWFFASFILGTIVVLILPSARKKTDSEEERERLRKNGNKNGLFLLGLTALLLLIRILGSF